MGRGGGEGKPGYNFQLVKVSDQRLVNIKFEKLKMARKSLTGWKGNENGMERMANIQIDKKLE